jgi:hypothetical protein
MVEVLIGRYTLTVYHLGFLAIPRDYFALVATKLSD